MIVDFRTRNVSATKVEGIDVALDKIVSTSLGDFGFSVNGTYVLSYSSAVTPGATFVDAVDTINNPAASRVRATASWLYRGFGASLSANHVGSYRDDSRRPLIRSIDAWNTIDVRLTYASETRDVWWAGMELSLTASNVLDRDPPFTNNALGYDTPNSSALGRFVALQLTKTW